MTPNSPAPSAAVAAIRIETAPDPAALPTGHVLALGNFDGVHRGHLELAHAARDLAGTLGVRAAALTFEPHPRSLFQPQQPVFRLTPPPLKAELLAQAGLDPVLSVDFDRATAAIPAEDFVDGLLLGRLGARGLVCGYDFHFGKGRSGSPEMLAARAQAHGVPLVVVPPFGWRGEPVSSTRVRQALEQGDVAAAADLLGRVWTLRGEIAHGDKRGRELGFPTANMHLARDCRLRHGIYAVRIRIDGRWHDGVASFGSRPTFDDGAPRLETFVFDFSADLYGKTVDVAFVGWLRGEAKFDSLDALIAQMNADSTAAREILARTPRFLP